MIITAPHNRAAFIANGFQLLICIAEVFINLFPLLNAVKKNWNHNLKDIFDLFF